MLHRLLSTAILILLLLVIATATSAAESIDRNTQRHGIHSCPPGLFVVGVHVDNNMLLCGDVFGTYLSTNEIIDTSTVVQGMHSCPEGMAMTGLHVERNLLGCAPISSSSRARMIDVVTQRNGMHACPEGYPMSGIHVNRNLLLCGTTSGFNAGVFIDAGTQRGGMHSCPQGFFAIGVHIDRNLLLCTDTFGAYQPSQEIVDSGTVSYDMHACPEGMGITGLEANRNLLACAPVGTPPTRRIVDSATQRLGMHACPAMQPLSGIQVNKNLLLCGTQSGLKVQLFEASPKKGLIEVGASATLTWQVSGCGPDCNVSLEGHDPHPVLYFSHLSAMGSQTVTPRWNTTYTLRAATPQGESDSRDVRIQHYRTTETQPSGVSPFCFRMTNPNSVVTKCFAICVYESDQAHAKQEAERENGGYMASAIDGSQFASACP
jgi:hypothetical protein